jgi:hypothetical protein
MAIVDRPTELSERVLESVQKGQQDALEALRTFVAAIDEALPSLVHEKRQHVLESGFSMADRLIGTQYGFLREVVRGAGESLGATRANDESAQE